MISSSEAPPCNHQQRAGRSDQIVQDDAQATFPAIPMKQIIRPGHRPGFHSIKKRNNANAASCATKLAGVTSQRISQNATTSSHTMAPGSSTRRCLAVTVQAHQPTAIDANMTQPICAEDKYSCITANEAQAQRVPTVPGAMRESPEACAERHNMCGMGKQESHPRAQHARPHGGGKRSSVEIAGRQ